MVASVTVEIECQDEENGFHTTYNVEKYTKYARSLEQRLRQRLADEGIDHEVRINPGPGKGWEQYHNIKGWYCSRRTPSVKVRYPRLGAFEVNLRCCADFAPASVLPAKVEAYSKLATRRWPDVDRLADDVARLLAAAQCREDVTDILRRLKIGAGTADLPPSPGTGHGADAAAAPPKGRMFFGLAPRGGMPTPVDVRTAASSPGGSRQQSFSSSAWPLMPPSRPMSAGTLRPSSAGASGRISAGASTVVSAPASTSVWPAVGGGAATRPPRPSSAPRQRSAPSAGVSAGCAASTAPPAALPPRPQSASAVAPAIPLAPASGAAPTPPATVQETLRQQPDEDPDDIFEDDGEDEDEFETSATLPAVPAPAPPAQATPPAPPASAPEVLAPIPAPLPPKLLARDLANRLYAKDSTSLPRTLIESLASKNPSVHRDAPLDLDSFKSRLYSLGVFRDPFNFNGLYSELDADKGDLTSPSLALLALALEQVWPVHVNHAPPQPPPVASAAPVAPASDILPSSASVPAAPAIASTSKVVGGYDHDSEFEDDDEEAQPAPPSARPAVDAGGVSADATQSAPVPPTGVSPRVVAAVAAPPAEAPAVVAAAVVAPSPPSPPVVTAAVAAPSPPVAPVVAAAVAAPSPRAPAVVAAAVVAPSPRSPPVVAAVVAPPARPEPSIEAESPARASAVAAPTAVTARPPVSYDDDSAFEEDDDECEPVEHPSPSAPAPLPVAPPPAAPPPMASLSPSHSDSEASGSKQDVVVEATSATPASRPNVVNRKASDDYDEDFEDDDIDVEVTPPSATKPVPPDRKDLRSAGASSAATNAGGGFGSDVGVEEDDDDEDVDYEEEGFEDENDDDSVGGASPRGNLDGGRPVMDVGGRNFDYAEDGDDDFEDSVTDALAAAPAARRDDKAESDENDYFEDDPFEDDDSIKSADD